MAFKAKLPLTLFLALSLAFLCSIESDALSKGRDPEKERKCLEVCERLRASEEVRERCRQRCREQYGGGGSEDGPLMGRINPYLFKEEEEDRFSTDIETEDGRLRILERFDERSDLLLAIRKYRLSIVEANPHTLAVPSHGDAEALLFVAQGRGTVKMVRRDRLESIDVGRGDLIRVESGTPVYTINRDEKEKLHIVKLFESVSAPGNFQEFFGPGGENPESFYSAFSPELIEAALKIRREKLERLGRRKGIFVKASREQIRSLSGDSEEGGMWPFGDESRSNKINIFKQRPVRSNRHGRLQTVDRHDFPRLRDLNTAVSYVNITQGSMTGPLYNSKTFKISVVIEGKGYFEMACPHVSSREKEQEEEGGSRDRKSSRSERQTSPPNYKKVRGELRPGAVLVAPPGHPIAIVASSGRNRGDWRRGTNGNLEILFFEVNYEGNVRYPLAGKGNVISWLEDEAKALAFGASADEVKEAFERQDEEVFFPGPEQHQEQGEEEDEGRSVLRAYA